jgi:hypothetical protein
MVNRTLPEHAAGKRAAQYLLSHGLASFAEIAALSGRSRQVVRLWSTELNAESARQKHLKKIWREALAKHG